MICNLWNYANLVWIFIFVCSLSARKLDKIACQRILHTHTRARIQIMLQTGHMHILAWKKSDHTLILSHSTRWANEKTAMVRCLRLFVHIFSSFAKNVHFIFFSTDYHVLSDKKFLKFEAISIWNWLIERCQNVLCSVLLRSSFWVSSFFWIGCKLLRNIRSITVITSILDGPETMHSRIRVLVSAMDNCLAAAVYTFCVHTRMQCVCAMNTHAMAPLIPKLKSLFTFFKIW